MKILLLGYGKEGQAAEEYFKNHYQDAQIDILQNFNHSELQNTDYSSYDIIFRSPSVPPFHLPNESSITKYFFDHCPCKIIGVTATKGKGTTCSFIKSLLDAEGEDVYLVGNIGEPAINVLDQLNSSSIVVYEMSSFQLWDLEKSPHISVIGQIEPDHLNVHDGYDDYLNAKSNIVRYQDTDDYCIYYEPNPDTVRIASASDKPHKIPYPFTVPDDILAAINLPGRHNQMNAMAAIAAVASYYNISPDEFLSTHADTIRRGLANFHGLPHRLEFVRELDGIKFYDDNFSTNTSSTRVAVESFPSHSVILILGGRDKTGNADLPEIYEIAKSPNVKHVILIGESGHALMERYPDSNFSTAESLKEAVETAYRIAKTCDSPIILMSPSAASFDMFKNVYDRGDQYQQLVSDL